jgi:hypothetical protein
VSPTAESFRTDQQEFINFVDSAFVEQHHQREKRVIIWFGE